MPKPVLLRIRRFLCVGAHTRIVRLRLDSVHKLGRKAGHRLEVCLFHSEKTWEKCVSFS